MYEITKVTEVLEVGDKVAKHLGIIHDDFAGRIGTLISINPCIVEYDDKVFNVCNISSLQYRGDEYIG